MKYSKILIQGAMNIETEYLINNLEQKERKEVSGYEFYEGKIGKTKVIISKTEIGTINSAAATIIGLTNFSPDIIINQGIAGAHKEEIHIGDIVIGEKCCNINVYEMPAKDKDEGSNPFLWQVSKREKNQYADKALVQCIQKFLEANYNEKVYIGTLGSGDVFNREIDRINWINSKFGNLSEDMESIGTYSICNRFNVPCVGVRIISNNEITKEELDEKQAIKLQKMLLNYIKEV